MQLTQKLHWIYLNYKKKTRCRYFNLEDPIINDDHIDLYSRYSNVCLKRIKEELNLAEDDYNDMFDKLTKSLSLLATHENHLAKSYNILDQGLWIRIDFLIIQQLPILTLTLNWQISFYPIAIYLILN